MNWKNALKDRVTKCLAVSIFIYILSLGLILSTEFIVIPLWIENVGLSVFVTSGVVSILCLVVSDRRKSKLKLQGKGVNEK